MPPKDKETKKKREHHQRRRRCKMEEERVEGRGDRDDRVHDETNDARER